MGQYELANADDMTDRARELETAADAIDPASLQATTAAVAASCQEILFWAELFYPHLKTIEPSIPAYIQQHR